MYWTFNRDKNLSDFIHLYSCFKDEQISYGFGTTWGCEIVDYFFFEWTCPLHFSPIQKYSCSKKKVTSTYKLISLFGLQVSGLQLAFRKVISLEISHTVLFHPVLWMSTQCALLNPFMQTVFELFNWRSDQMWWPVYAEIPLSSICISLL